MKKTLYLLPFLLLMVLLQTACSSDDPIPPIIDKDFDVSSRNFSFSTSGGEQVLTIISDEEIDWDAYSSISWIKLGKPDYEKKTITITVDPTNEVDPAVGTITVFSKPSKSIKIQVQRDGLGIIHDRSSLSRMNLRNDISQLSYHLNPTYIFEVAYSDLTNLKFNENGMLVSFMNEYAFSEELTITYTNTLTYDSQNRLTKLDAISDAIVEGTGEKAKHVLDFVYGNHGKYIDTPLLSKHLQLIYCNSDFRVWLPKMIKDLTKIEIFSNAFVISPNSTIDIEISGDTGVCHYNYIEEEEPQSMLLAEYSFSGNFLRQVSHLEFLMGYPITCISDYLIDAKTGNILSVIKTSEDFGPETLSHEIYTTDNTNQLCYYSDMLIGYDMTIEFNDKMDVVNMVNLGDFEAIGEYEYLYDEKGNWTNIKATNLVTGHITELDKNRTIEYR